MAATTEDDLREVREGFLCPVCHVDQSTISQLQLHYENVHSNEERATINTFKELLGKAKRKILKQDEAETDSMSPDDSTYIFTSYQDQWEYQELGTTRSHTEFLKKVRDFRNDRYVLETNKLLIRLDKLMTDLPADPLKRKAHEKAIVVWAPDDAVPLCPNCTRPFNLIRRKHHCRLCGAIMCANCSQFMTLDVAKRLTNASERSNLSGKGSSSAGPATPVHTPLGLLSIPRTGSSTSLNSLLNSSGEPHIRVCSQCNGLLGRHDKNLEQQNSKPIVVQIYDRLKSCMDDSDKMCAIYIKMIESLRTGESIYSYKDAQELRIKLMKLAESIDLLSKKILVMGAKEINDGEIAPSPKDMQLQRGIYLCANAFLKDRMLGLPLVPTEEEISRFREQRKRDLERKIAEEKRMALELQQQHQTTSSTRSFQRNFALEVSPRKEHQTSLRSDTVNADVSIDDGWGPEMMAAAKIIDNDDPIILQMNIIRNYIKQAKQAYKFEEVRMLEENLKELQEEYWRQRE